MCGSSNPRRILLGDICLEDGVVSYIGLPLDRTEGYTVIDGTGQYAVPGFIDIHCHGGVGFDFTSGVYDTKQKRVSIPQLRTTRSTLDASWEALPIRARRAFFFPRLPHPWKGSRRF